MDVTRAAGWILSLGLLGAAPAVPGLTPCPASTPTRIAPGDPAASVVSLALAREGDVDASLEALAVEVLEPGQDLTGIEVRFAPGGDERWEWLGASRAMLGHGFGPRIARIPDKVPAWLVAFSRIESQSARPVAVLIRADEAGRRLDLTQVILETADHVFGAVPLWTGDAPALLWGQSQGASDSMMLLPGPVEQSTPPVILTSGSLDAGFEALAGGDGILVAWTEPDGSVEETRLLVSRHDPSGKPTAGPALAWSGEEPARILSLVSDHGIQVLLLVRESMIHHCATVSLSGNLDGATVKPHARPRLVPGTPVTGCLTDQGPVLAWQGGRGSLVGLRAWSGGGTWIVTAGDHPPALDSAAAKGGLRIAWSDPGGGIMVDRIHLADADGDTFPDTADICPTLAEPADGRVDHDGCPDPPPCTSSPLDAGQVWFTTSLPCTQPLRAAVLVDGTILVGSREDGGSYLLRDGGIIVLPSLPGPVTTALPLAAGGAALVADGSLHHLAPDGNLAARPLGEPEATVRDVITSAGGPVALTSRGAVRLSPENLEPAGWIAEDLDLTHGAWQDGHGFLFAGPSGKLVSLSGKGGAATTVAPPKGVTSEQPVSIAASGTSMLVAYETSGVFERKGPKAGWTPRSLTGSGGAGPEGVAEIAGLPAQGIALLSTDGTIHTWTAKGWMRMETGLETVWVMDLGTSAAGRPHALGVSTRPVLLTLHHVLERRDLGAEHFVKSGKKLRKSASGPLGPALEGVLAGKHRIRLEGHTDSSGSVSGNLDLSLRRALTVKAWFVDRGADPAWIECIGFGESHPKYKPASTKNRRVEVILLEP
jgi:hypothetical protein